MSEIPGGPGTPFKLWKGLKSLARVNSIRKVCDDLMIAAIEGALAVTPRRNNVPPPNREHAIAFLPILQATPLVGERGTEGLFGWVPRMRQKLYRKFPSVEPDLQPFDFRFSKWLLDALSGTSGKEFLEKEGFNWPLDPAETAPIEKGALRAFDKQLTQGRYKEKTHNKTRNDILVAIEGNRVRSAISTSEPERQHVATREVLPAVVVGTTVAVIGQTAAELQPPASLGTGLIALVVTLFGASILNRQTPISNQQVALRHAVLSWIFMAMDEVFSCRPDGLTAQDVHSAIDRCIGRYQANLANSTSSPVSNIPTPGRTRVGTQFPALHTELEHLIQLSHQIEERDINAILIVLHTFMTSAVEPDRWLETLKALLKALGE